MIISLLLKQSNKIAYINNLISLSKFNESLNLNTLQPVYFNFYTSSTTSITTLTTSKFTLTKSQIEIYNQDISKIQRKKDETLYLKLGVDKRAVFVKQFLKK
jgi:hypothetical protein